MQYRFVTPNTKGKWYADIKVAMKQACAIGAGYYDKASDRFYKYRETQLQVRGAPEAEPSLAA